MTILKIGEESALRLQAQGQCPLPQKDTTVLDQAISQR